MRVTAKSVFFVIATLVVIWLARELSRPYWDQELIEARARHSNFFKRHAEIEDLQRAWRRFQQAEAGGEMSFPSALESFSPKHYKEVNWNKWGEPLSYEELKARLVPDFAEDVPESDFMGFKYEFRVKDKVLAIRNPGCDGEFEGLFYARVIHKMDECSGDTVLVGGSFIQWIYVPADEGEY